MTTPRKTTAVAFLAQCSGFARVTQCTSTSDTISRRGERKIYGPFPVCRPNVEIDSSSKSNPPFQCRIHITSKYTICNFPLAGCSGSRSRMGGHGDLLLCGDGILSPPQTGDGLPLGVESEAVLAVEVRSTGTSNRLLVTCEAEHGQRDWDGYIDTDLTCLKLLLEQ